MLQYMRMNTTCSISKIDDVKKLLESDCSNISKIDIKLFDGEKYKNNSLKALMFLSKNFNKLNLQNKISIDINVLYEKLPKKLFLHILKFYENTKHITKCNICVKHEFEDRYVDTEIKKWDIESILKANLEIEDVCKFIKINSLSPIEALAYIHFYVQSVAKANESKKIVHEWCDNDQFFVGAYLKLPEVVCMGYSTLMKEIIDNLNMPELKCEIISVQFEHLKKGYTAGHARCFVFVKDKKYGIDQSFFDDPTWDDEACLKYAHFAMPNNCHDLAISNNYDYRKPKLIKLNNLKNSIEYQYNVVEDMIFNNSNQKLDQHDIEKIYFTVLQKIHPKSNFEKIYEKLKEIAENSYKEQEVRNYFGNLTQPQLMLSKKEAQNLYKKNTIKRVLSFEL